MSSVKTRPLSPFHTDNVPIFAPEPFFDLTWTSENHKEN